MATRETYLDLLCQIFGIQPWVTPVLTQLMDMKDENGTVILHDENRGKIRQKAKISAVALRQALYQLSENGLLKRKTVNFYVLHPALLAPLNGAEKEIRVLLHIDKTGARHLSLMNQTALV